MKRVKFCEIWHISVTIGTPEERIEQFQKQNPGYIYKKCTYLGTRHIGNNEYVTDYLLEFRFNMLIWAYCRAKKMLGFL